MRHLSRKQKKMLDKWYKENKNLSGLGVFNLGTCNEFTYKFYEDLIEVNNFEILYDCINRYICDKVMHEDNNK